MHSWKWRCALWSWMMLASSFVALLVVALVALVTPAFVVPLRYGLPIGFVVSAALLVAAVVWLLARSRSDSSSDG